MSPFQLPHLHFQGEVSPGAFSGYSLKGACFPLFLVFLALDPV